MIYLKGKKQRTKEKTDGLENEITSVCLAPADMDDIRLFMKLGFFTHQSDAIKEALRRGIVEIKKERGIYGQQTKSTG